MSNSVCSRRQALKLVTAIALMGGAPALRAATQRQPLDASFFAGFELDPQLVRELLAPLWASGELPRDPRALAATIAADTAIDSAAVNSAAIDSAALRVRIRAQIATDFSSGDTVKVGGWILSRTETRVWALYALTRG